MKIRLPILATALASTVALAPGLSQASTFQDNFEERYAEYVYYDFTYFLPHFSVAVEEVWDEETERWSRRASRWTDLGGYDCINPATGNPDWDCESDVIWFGFGLEGSEIVPLDNLTFDLLSRPTTLSGRTFLYYYSSLEWIDWCYSDSAFSYGSLSFGPTGEVAAYDMGFASECYAATSFQASSSPILLTDLFADELATIEDAELLEGIFAYDSRYWEPWDLYFSQRPGYWRTSITRWCGFEVYYNGWLEDPDTFVTVPCPGDGLVTPGPGVPSTLTPPAPIPLPAAGWLLLGALGTLGLARRRRG